MPDAEGSAGRRPLDHLYLDAAGVPTLVEVKRSSDTRARREGIAQMLDYAANATAFWKVDLVQAWFETECERRGTDSAGALERHLASLVQTAIGVRSRRTSPPTAFDSSSSRMRSPPSFGASSSYLTGR